MKREELNKVFEWLEEHINYNCLFDLKLSDNNQITAYWRNDNKPFAQFYIKQVLRIIKDSDIK